MKKRRSIGQILIDFRTILILIFLIAIFTYLKPVFINPINLLNMPKGCAFCPRCENAMKICLEENAPEMQMPDGHFASCWLNVKAAMEAKGGAGKR